MVRSFAPTSACLVLSTVLLAQHEIAATETSPVPVMKAQSTLAFVSPKQSSSSPTLAPVPSRFSNCEVRAAIRDRLESRHSVPFFAHAPMSFDNGHLQRVKLAPLYATIDDSAIRTNNVIERLELDQQFERWRFFQRLLEGELAASDVEDVLLVALSAYLRHGPAATSSNNKNDNGGNASPVLTEEQRSAMEKLLNEMATVSDGIGDSRFLHMLVLPPVDYESTDIDVVEEATGGDDTVAVDSNALSILRQLEQLLPDPVEDEEAFQSSWDVVIDLYGRESVRVREEALQREEEGGSDVSDGGGDLKCCAENLQWRTVCTVGRLLIHFDFLTKGVMKEGTFN